MSANVEKMFYVSNEANERFVPWHGLGTPVEKLLRQQKQSTLLVLIGM